MSKWDIKALGDLTRLVEIDACRACMHVERVLSTMSPAAVIVTVVF